MGDTHAWHYVFPSSGSASLIDKHDLTHLLSSEDFRLHGLLTVEAQMIGDLVSSIISFSPEQEASVTQTYPFKMSG